MIQSILFYLQANQADRRYLLHPVVQERLCCPGPLGGHGCQGAQAGLFEKRRLQKGWLH